MTLSINIEKYLYKFSSKYLLLLSGWSHAFSILQISFHLYNVSSSSISSQLRSRKNSSTLKHFFCFRVKKVSSVVHRIEKRRRQQTSTSNGSFSTAAKKSTCWSQKYFFVFDLADNMTRRQCITDLLKPLFKGGDLGNYCFIRHSGRSLL